ncbi:hypothetical protein LOC67_12515 [Stieleria sp. JC731]|uniref:hypothetical protein n=1 Tax=Stieleria sp. JC731 TaxID=2894195 RepID=UPI001E3F6664|nr:hypothetical protein [Stieleria sp. JC731]MCC9601370.1 hypothetical protein [Stieleria sp. JC731]
MWTTSRLSSSRTNIRRVDDVAVDITRPLFWYEPPWIDLPPIIASRLAASVANLEIVVSALRRDLSETDGEPGELFWPIENGEEPDSTDRQSFLPRIAPYRAERYGFTTDDFDHAKLIDVRLAPARDPSGRFAYSPRQMQRWERSESDSPISGGGYVAASTFPADIITAEQAKNKLQQLRRLAPTSAVFVSVNAYRLEEQLAAATAAVPDGLFLRCDHPEFEGLQIAAIVASTRKFLRRNNLSELPLWVVPGEISADDIAKLIALGASAVAIDSWCAPLLDVLQEELQHAHSIDQVLREIPSLVSEHLWNDIDRVVGLCSSIELEKPTNEKLGTFHQKWAKACSAAMLA